VSLNAIDRYVHPVTKVPLIRDINGNLCERDNTKNILYRNDSGTYDFVSKEQNTQERDYYEKSYRRKTAKPLSIKDCRNLWGTGGGFGNLYMSMGDVSGKKILLLGNGLSTKEFYFLSLGAMCVYTDLSLKAVKYMKTIFDESEFKQSGFDNIEFHAVDSCHMPFPDESFDIIYGCAFVHHIENIDMLFSEVARCLKPGGICRFMDHAYSPLWQFLKKSVLKPLQIYSHRKHGISPADMAATKRGGYKYEELKHIKETYEFREMLYLRMSFFEYLLQRGTCKLGGRFLRKLKPLMRALDVFLDKLANLVQKHGIVLVWGFTK